MASLRDSLSPSVLCWAAEVVNVKMFSDLFFSFTVQLTAHASRLQLLFLAILWLGGSMSLKPFSRKGCLVFKMPWFAAQGLADHNTRPGHTVESPSYDLSQAGSYYVYSTSTLLRFSHIGMSKPSLDLNTAAGRLWQWESVKLHQSVCIILSVWATEEVQWVSVTGF